ncbi:ca2+-activated RelA/spot-like protein [Wolffia australiana]
MAVPGGLSHSPISNSRVSKPFGTPIFPQIRLIHSAISNSNGFNPLGGPICSQIHLNHLPISKYRASKPFGAPIRPRIRLIHSSISNSNVFNPLRRPIRSRILLDHLPVSNSRDSKALAAEIPPQVRLNRSSISSSKVSKPSGAPIPPPIRFNHTSISNSRASKSFGAPIPPRLRLNRTSISSSSASKSPEIRLGSKSPKRKNDFERPIRRDSIPRRNQRRWRLVAVRSEAGAPLVEQPGGKMVAELVGVFNELTERMGTTALSTFSTQLLFRCLTLSIPLLRQMPGGPDGRPPLSRALAIACTLADLQMDAEVISAGIMRVILEVRAMSLLDVQSQVGSGISHLLHESLRMRKVRSKVDTLDDESAAALRKFCLSYYDIRAIVLELVLKLDRMRHIGYLPKHHQQRISLEVLKIHAPLAHTIGATALSLELEDLSFQHLFPHSYHSVDQWLRSHELGRSSIITYRDHLLHHLRRDEELSSLVDDIAIEGRRKSRFSTMKKLLKDGRRPKDVHDVLGLRVILSPKQGDDAAEMDKRVCYKAQEIVKSLWREISSRTKDYIARPKPNGYRSLHMTVDVSGNDNDDDDDDDDHGKILPMEVQIRTREMDFMANGGPASHSLYKGGLTDPSEAKRLKAIMMAAAELAALRLKDPENIKEKMGIDGANKDRIFHLLDTNGDGRISLEELTDVMKELGATGDDAVKLMQVLDSNSDGSLSSDEFESFQKQVNSFRSLEDEDDHYKAVLSKKLRTDDNTGLIKVYHKELGDKLALS